MIKILVTNKLSGQVQESLLPSMEAANAWIEECELKEAWGKPFHIVNHPELSEPQASLIVHHDEVVTPVADLVIHHDEVVTPVGDLIIHHEESIDANGEIIPAWYEVIPQPPIVTPAWDESIPQAPIATPAYDEIIPQPDIVIPAWTEEVEAEYTIEIVDISAEMDAKDLQCKYDYLWKAANDFQSGQISGAAIGLLTIGVLAQKPKCTAVQAWIKSVWVEYYTRKAGVSLQNNVNLDFSVCGNIPYTVPELMEEVSI